MIPAYNEEKSIAKVLDKIKEQQIEQYADILVIDDGSKDETVAIVEQYDIPALKQIYNMGYGAALQTGYKYAVKHQYQYLIQLDADGQHDISNIQNIYQRLQQEKAADIVIGSRFLDGSKTFKVSGIRRFAMKVFTAAIHGITGIRITDPTSGLQGLKRSAFSYYAEYRNFDVKYPDANMIIQMLLLGYKVEEIPVVMHERAEGVAMHSGILQPAIYMMLMTISTLNTLYRFRKKS